eukprot:COSAG05_NODE_5694_length_1114_cov_1.149754_1_plen_294_part_10
MPEDAAVRRRRPHRGRQLQVRRAPAAGQPRTSMLQDSAPRPLVLVLVGHCGVGKSSTANTLLGRSEFTARRSAATVTRRCQRARTAAASGREVCVLDTPGLGDPEVSDDETRKEMLRGYKEATAEYGEACDCVLLLVLQVGGRVSTDHLKAFGMLGTVFGLQMYRHAVALFTHGDFLTASSGGLQGYLSEAGEACRAFLKDVRGGSLLLSNSVELRPAEGTDQMVVGGVVSRECAEALARVLQQAEPVVAKVSLGGGLAPPKPNRKAARRERQQADAIRHATEAATRTEEASSS